MSVNVLNNQNFDESLNGEELKVIKFGATWCGPCKMIAPVLEELSEKYTDVSFYEVDVDESQELAMKYGIRGVPTVFIMKNKEILEQFVGYKSAPEISEIIDRH